MKRSLLLLSLLLVNAAQAQSLLTAKSAARARTEVAPLLAEMGAAANRHDVEAHVGFYAHDPAVTLIFNGTPLVGWQTIRDRQRQWWNEGDTDVVYSIVGKPDFQVLAPRVVVSTLLMTSRRTLPNGEVKEGEFAVSSVWQRRPEGWRVIYSHESTSH
jgi:ketosteroid isomerase-like protein